MRASIVVVCVGLWAGTARAQTGAEAKAAADAAFDKGKQLKDAGKCDEAIEQFAKSQALDPQLGTQYNLALCYQDVGRLASAWGEYNEIAAKDTNKKRKADAAKRAKAIAPQLTRMAITVEVPVDGLVITRDDVDVTALIDVETPVDPGVSNFTASAPGYAAWHEEVDLTAPGVTVAILVPPLEPIGDDPPDEPDEPESIEPDRLVKPTMPRPTDPGKGRRLLGLGLAGAGVVAVGVGLFFGSQAMGLTSDAETACGGSLQPCLGDVPAAQVLIDDARGKATLANLFVGAGAAVAITGVVLWLTAPTLEATRAAAITPVVSRDGLGLAYDGSW